MYILGLALMKNVFKLPLAVAVSAATFTGISLAQDWYVSGQVAWLDQDVSTNGGEFTSDFTTGNSGGLLPTGTVLADETSLRWRTKFDNGYSASVEVGRKLDDLIRVEGLRGALEVVYTKADVDMHSGLTAGGLNIDGADVSVLTGDPVASGATVGDTVRAGQGSIQNTAAFVNVYKDFGSVRGVKPYVGVGLGVSEVNVKYNPSGVNIVKDDAVQFAWQGKVGASYTLNGRFDVFTEAAYRASQDVDVRSNLLPASVEVANEQFQVGVGLRMRFGH